jgi:hypothetical protein
VKIAARNRRGITFDIEMVGTFASLVSTERHRDRLMPIPAGENDK